MDFLKMRCECEEPPYNRFILVKDFSYNCTAKPRTLLIPISFLQTSVLLFTHL